MGRMTIRTPDTIEYTGRYINFAVGTDNGPTRHARHGRYGSRVSGRPFPYAHQAYEETVHVAAVLVVLAHDARGGSPDIANARLQPGKCRGFLLPYVFFVLFSNRPGYRRTNGCPSWTRWSIHTLTRAVSGTTVACANAVSRCR